MQECCIQRNVISALAYEKVGGFIIPWDITYVFIHNKHLKEWKLSKRMLELTIYLVGGSPMRNLGLVRGFGHTYKEKLTINRVKE